MQTLKGLVPTSLPLSWDRYGLNINASQSQGSTSEAGTITSTLFTRLAGSPLKNTVMFASLLSASQSFKRVTAGGAVHLEVKTPNNGHM